MTSLKISGALLSGKLGLRLKLYHKSVLGYRVSELSTGIVDAQGLFCRSELQYNETVLEVGQEVELIQLPYHKSPHEPIFPFLI